MRKEETVFVLVDVQGKLAEVMHERDLLYENLRKLVSGMKAIGVPIVWVEQLPDKMGQTIAPLRELLNGQTPVTKASFSCCGEPAFLDRLAATGRSQVVIAGIEVHVCVFQTAADLVQRGYHVEVVADAVSSRTLSNKLIGLEKARAAGACVTSVESALFELLKTASAPEFRDILKIVK